MASTAGTIFAVVFLLLAFAGNIIALGGLAKLTDMCRDNDITYQLFGEAPIPKENRAYDCGVLYSLDWWIVCFQVFVVIFATIATFAKLFNNAKFIYHCLSVVTTLYCSFAYKYVLRSYEMKDTTNDYSKSVDACAAGAICVLVSNFLYGITWSTDGPAPAECETAAPKTGGV